MRRFLAVLLAAGLVLGACGGDSGGGPDPADDPQGALTNAFANLTEYEGTSMTFSVDSTTDDLVALAEGDMTEDQADIILNSSISFSGTQAESLEDAQFEFVVDIDGSLIEVRFVNSVLYARGDVRDLVDKFGGDQAEVDQAVSEGSAQLPFVEPLVEGEWIGFEGFQQLLDQAAGGGLPSPDPEMAQKFADDLSKVIEDNATVTEEGSDDAGTHLVADVNIKDLYGALQESFASLSQVPGAELPTDEEIPDENIKVDFWVDDGFITQIGFDLVQFKDIEGAEDFPEEVDEFALLLEIEEFGDSIEEPDAAETVNLQELMGGLMGGLGGLDGLEGEDTSGGTGSSEDETKGGGDAADTIEAMCEALKDAPAEVQEQYAEQCPEFAQ
jgi:hypothetical protein